MTELLDYLDKAEGVEVHYNEGEKDITTPYGVYAHIHPEAKIVTHIVKIAKLIGIEKPSREWIEQDIKDINSQIKVLKAEKRIRDLAEEFYREFLKDAHLDLFPKYTKIAMFSMFTNSNKYAWMAVQQSFIDMQKTGIAVFGKLSIADGIYGFKTQRALEKVNSMNGGIYLSHYFETLMLSNMKTLYIRLALSNPEKYLKYLKGWDNRMSELARF